MLDGLECMVVRIDEVLLHLEGQELLPLAVDQDGGIPVTDGPTSKRLLSYYWT